MIRGLEPDRYSLEDSVIVFLGIQSHIAEGRMRQDEAGNMLGRIMAPQIIVADHSDKVSSSHNL